MAEAARVLRAIVLVVILVVRVSGLWVVEGVRCCAQPHDRPAPFQVGVDVLHLLRRQGKKAREDHQPIRILQTLESRNVRSTRFYVAVFVQPEQNSAMETVML